MLAPNLPAMQRSLTDVVAEYDLKLSQIDAALAEFRSAGEALKRAATIGGTWGNVTLRTGDISETELKRSLLRSAWRHVYDGLNISRISSADDRRKWEYAIENPVPFTIDNIRGTFGPFILDPRGNILRALAETFCSLDPFYRSHEKVKIGVKGLPKRIVLRSVGYWSSYGMEKLRDVLNALASYRGEPLVEYKEFSELDKLGGLQHRAGEVTIRGLRIRKFQNGNAHVFFDKVALRDINKALAEFYGDVLPDAYDRPDKPMASSAVAKDLQYYATPAKVAKDVMDDIYVKPGMRGLDPSCGDGRLLDAMRAAGVHADGIEFDGRRAEQARAKGFGVVCANFLECPATAKYDLVFMNPPFYGKHYVKHVQHALKFLQPGGTLVAILPSSARYDHKLLEGSWRDLPVGAFSESGTNVSTSVLTIHKKA